ncbi:hypothetical protein GF324_02280, partial [bacterium]|nr:hypothetical protein [bacterium]
VAMQLTNILRDVKEDAGLGRIYLPREELEAGGVSEEDLLDGRFTDEVASLMRFQVERARDYYTVAEPGIAMLDRDARFAVSSAARMYSGILSQLEQRACNPFEGRVYVSKPRKLTMLLTEWIRTRFELPAMTQTPETVDAA